MSSANQHAGGAMFSSLKFSTLRSKRPQHNQTYPKQNNAQHHRKSTSKCKRIIITTTIQRSNMDPTRANRGRTVSCLVQYARSTSYASVLHGTVYEIIVLQTSYCLPCAIVALYFVFVLLFFCLFFFAQGYWTKCVRPRRPKTNEWCPSTRLTSHIVATRISVSICCIHLLCIRPIDHNYLTIVCSPSGWGS